MFKRVEICLTDPICDCETQDLGWSITTGPGLKVSCNNCKTSIEIPNKKFHANFILDKKYPKYKCNTCDELHDTGLTHDQAIIKQVIE